MRFIGMYVWFYNDNDYINKYNNDMLKLNNAIYKTIYITEKTNHEYSINYIKRKRLFSYKKDVILTDIDNLYNSDNITINLCNAISNNVYDFQSKGYYYIGYENNKTKYANHSNKNTSKRNNYNANVNKIKVIKTLTNIEVLFNEVKSYFYNVGDSYSYDFVIDTFIISKHKLFNSKDSDDIIKNLQRIYHLIDFIVNFKDQRIIDDPNRNIWFVLEFDKDSENEINYYIYKAKQIYFELFILFSEYFEHIIDYDSVFLYVYNILTSNNINFNFHYVNYNFSILFKFNKTEFSNLLYNFYDICNITTI